MIDDFDSSNEIVSITDADGSLDSALLRSQIWKDIDAEIFGLHKEQKGEIAFCDDPREYVELLKSTDEYRKLVESEIEETKKKTHADINYYEFSDYFSGESGFRPNDKYFVLFWKFFRHVVRLTYNSEKHSEEFNREFKEYCLLLDQKRDVVGQEEAVINDEKRSSQHKRAARALLKEESVNNFDLARVIVRAYLIDCGKETQEVASVEFFSDQVKGVDGVTLKEAAGKLKQAINNANVNIPDFSQETIDKTRKGLSKTPSLNKKGITLNMDRSMASGLRRQKGDQENWKR